MLYRLTHLIYPLIALFAIAAPLTPASAEDDINHDAQTILHVLDYVSVDYGGTVLYEKILNETEYKEQVNFAEQAVTLLNRLPDHPNRAKLSAQAAEIAKDVKEKAPSDLVRSLAQQLRRGVIETYHITVSPRHLPNMLPAMATFQQLCMPCHGAQGKGDGPLSKSMTPRPANFYNDARMAQRSVYGLYNSISLGVGRTKMPAFTDLSDDDRWSLAFLVSNFRITADRIAQGKKFWENRSYEGPAPDLTALASLTENEISTRYGEQARAVFAYLRYEPKALLTTPHSTLIFATEQLDRALARYRENNRDAAQQLSIAAYLEGAEPMEISLDSLDKQLRRNIENEMMNIRLLISSGASVDMVAEKTSRAKTLLRQADERLRGGKLSVGGTFRSSIFILLRECLLGILIIVALITFMTKNDLRTALPYIHLGWIGAILLGSFTWIVTMWVTEISGIIREITSGITALTSAIMLLYFVLWIHRKRSHSAQDVTHPSPQITLKSKNFWMLSLLAFFALYRAVFESALFYEALWIQTAFGVRSVIWSGILTAALLLMITGWVVFSQGISQPLKTNLRYTYVLLCGIAVTFVGQGITSLQKAGIVTMSKIDFFTLPILGIAPTSETLLAQLGTIIVLVLNFVIFNAWHKSRCQGRTRLS